MTNRLEKFIANAAALLLLCFVLFAMSHRADAQVFGPTTKTSKLTVSPGATVVQDLTVNGTCTGCAAAVAGANTQVIYNDSGAYNGEAGLTYNETTDTVTAAGGVVIGTRNVYPTIYCTTACDITGIALGQSAIISKGTLTSVTSDNTPNADPDLQFSGVPANGLFAIEATIETTDAGTGGFKSQWSGLNNYNLEGKHWCNGAIVNVMHISTAGTLDCTTGATQALVFQGTIERVGSVGTIVFFWSQNTSNPAATAVAVGSVFKITRTR
jgi:hypothetical protein